MIEHDWAPSAPGLRDLSYCRRCGLAFPTNVVCAALSADELAIDAAKKEALERSSRGARDAEYRAAHRRLNRKERRKLASEIGKVERGDYS